MAIPPLLTGPKGAGQKKGGEFDWGSTLTKKPLARGANLAKRTFWRALLKEPRFRTFPHWQPLRGQVTSLLTLPEPTRATLVP